MEIKLVQEKAFNALLYFAQKIKPLYLSKAMMLLYLADEKAMKDSGVPITWLTYKAWKSGAGTYDIKQKGLEEFAIEQVDLADRDMAFPEGISQSSKKNFDDSNFSDYEIDILQWVIDQYGKYSAKQLRAILHKRGFFSNKNNPQQQLGPRSIRSYHVSELTDLLDTAFKKAANDWHISPG